MASTIPAFPSSRETTNFARLSRLLVDVGAQVLRKKFDDICPPGGLSAHLSSAPVLAALKILQTKRILNPTQWGHLFPTIPSSVTSQHFDITLLTVLLRNICMLTPPSTGWNSFPMPKDFSVEADIVRIKCFRNKVYGHASQASVDDATFNNYWQDIREPLVRLGGADYGNAIDNLRTECMDPKMEDHYTAMLKHWKRDDDNTKDMVGEILEKISELKTAGSPAQAEALPVKIYQSQLCTLYNTMSQVKITPWDPDNTVHIDDVYTQLSWLRDHKKPGGTTQEKLEDYTDIFKGHPNYPIPKRILVYGKPGIGKSTFAKKLAVDWARCKSKHNILNKFELVLLITLRDVCDIHDFDSILKKSCLLSSEDPALICGLYEYIIQNPKKVLLVLDGYDEYSYLAGHLSPVFKIWKGDEFRDCHVVTTTRPMKADELKKFSHVQCEIRGFDTEEQVKEFASRFLCGQKEVELLLHYLSEKNIWDLAEIPLLLLMLCLLCKERDCKELPTSRLDLYRKFIETLFHHMQAKDLRDMPKPLEDYSKELTQMGKLALEALLNDCLYFDLSHMQSDPLSEKLICVGLFQTSKLSSLDPQEKGFFVHKSFQEYLAAYYLLELKDFALIDSFGKILVMEEVLKFVCQSSVEGLRAVLTHFGFLGKKEGLTDYKLTQTPSLKDLTKDQLNVIRVAMDCFFCSPAWERPEMYSLFSSSLGGLPFFLFSTNHLDAVKHLLTSDNLLNFVVCNCWLSHNSYMFSFLEDIEALVVTSGKEFRASDFLRKNHVSPGGYKNIEFYLKNEGGKVYLYFTRLNKKVLQLFERPVSSEENTERSLKETSHHCLSFLREISLTEVECEDLKFLSNMFSRVIYPRNVTIVSSREKFTPNLLERMVSRMNFTYNLRELSLERLNLTAGCASLVANSLHQAPNLFSLCLSHNRLCSGVSDLAENLQNVQQLSCLRLIDVEMGDQECCSLAASLQFVPQLKVLDLSCNPLNHGITELVNHLNSVPLLTKLHLKRTQMGEEEAGALGRALRYVPQLLELDLGSNPLDQGVRFLIQHLSCVPQLVLLGLSQVQITPKEVDDLRRLTEKRRSIMVFTDYGILKNGSLK